MLAVDEYQVIRTDAGIVDRSARGRIELRGKDRLSHLHGLLTNDILALEPGRGCYAAYLTPQGRMIADMLVLELGEMTLLDVPAAVKDRLVRAFDDLVFTEDVQIADLTPGWAAIGVHGPASARMLAAVLEGGGAAALERRLLAFREHDNASLAFEAARVVVARTGETGGVGFHVFSDRDLSARLVDALRAQGARSISAYVMQVLRIEAGRPEFGVDMDETTIPLEADIQDRAISMTKGCYVGQEVIVRVLHRGHGRVVRKLVGLVLDDEVPVPGAAIQDGAQAIGEVTSAVFSPTLGKPIALGYVHRDFVEPGTRIAVVWADRSRPATVARLPFVNGPTR